MQTDAAPSPRFSCPRCRAQYHVSVLFRAERQPGTATCRVCGAIMSMWCETILPVYTLVEPLGTMKKPWTDGSATEHSRRRKPTGQSS